MGTLIHVKATLNKYHNRPIATQEIIVLLGPMARHAGRRLHNLRGFLVNNDEKIDAGHFD
ncbi:MAG TPA: hypothetical protein VGI60_14865 [Chthoniobacterales bacterium]